MLGNILDQELRFGVGTPQMVSWEKMVKQWKSIEALGFDSVWIADQFVICSKPTWPWFEGWTLLAGLATQTSRIRIGTMVTAIPWHNPAFLARKALTVDYISHGRLELGLGTGVHGDCGHKMTGIEDWSPRERVERFREFVEIVDQLLCNEEVTYQGRYYQLQEAAMNPSPIQKPRPPITIAAMGSAMLMHAACYADTWNTMGNFTGTFDERLENVQRQNLLLDKYCTEISRDPRTIRRSYVVYDPEMYVRDWEIPIYDSIDAIKDVVKCYREVGITEFLLYYPIVEKQIPIFEQMAREVIPEIRKRYR